MRGGILLRQPGWRPVDELIERDMDRHLPRGETMQEAFLRILSENKERQVLVDLPRRKGRAKSVVLSKEYLRAVHTLLAQGKPLPEIQKKYNVTKVALRVHRRMDCLCEKRGII